MPNFSLPHKRVKVLARMRIGCLATGKNRKPGFAAAAPRSGPRTAGFRHEIPVRAGRRERKNAPDQARWLRGVQELSVMKLFTGSLAAGLVLLAGSAQAQVRGPYTAASDVDAPYAVAPPPVPELQYVPGPHYAPGPQYRYGPGPG